MEEHIKNLEKRIDDQNSKMDQKFEEMVKLMQEIRAESNKRGESLSSSGLSDSISGRSNPTRTLGMNPKLEFPKFNGTNPRIWVKKCCKYFNLCKIADEQKVDLASLNMIDKAESWVMNYLSVRRTVVVDWNDFVVDLYARFKDSTGLDVVERFNRLQQQNSIEEYIDEFESLRSVMLMNNHVLPDSYILESFIGGLRPAVKPVVKAFKPVTIAQAVEYARLQEETLSSTVQTYKYNKQNYPTLSFHQTTTAPSLTFFQTPPAQHAIQKFLEKQIVPHEMQQRSHDSTNELPPPALNGSVISLDSYVQARKYAHNVQASSRFAWKLSIDMGAAAEQIDVLALGWNKGKKIVFIFDPGGNAFDVLVSLRYGMLKKFDKCTIDLEDKVNFKGSFMIWILIYQYQAMHHMLQVLSELFLLATCFFRSWTLRQGTNWTLKHNTLVSSLPDLRSSPFKGGGYDIGALIMNLVEVLAGKLVSCNFGSKDCQGSKWGTSTISSTVAWFSDS